MTTTTTTQLVRDAVEALDAVELGDGKYAYLASETARWYAVSEADMLDLGKMLSSAEPDAYSQWCARAEVVEMSAADLYEASLLDRTQIVGLIVGELERETGEVEVEAEVELSANDWSRRYTLRVQFGDELAGELPPRQLAEIAMEVLALAKLKMRLAGS